MERTILFQNSFVRLTLVVMDETWEIGLKIWGDPELHTFRIR